MKRRRNHFWEWEWRAVPRAAAVLALLAAVFVHVRVSAAAKENVWTGKTGSLLLSYCDSADGREPIAGAEFTLYRIGVLKEEIRDDLLLPDFRPLVKDRDGRWIAVNVAAEAAKIEEEVRAAYESGIPKDGRRYTGSTGSDGILLFEAVEPGAYLVVETRPAKKHRASAPFIFSVPFTAETKEHGRRRGGAWSWERAAEPKPQPCGDLVISKEVRGNAAEPGRVFHFRISLSSEEVFRFQKSDGSQGVIRSGDTAALSGGQTLTIEDIPVGTKYEVTEIEADRDGYLTEAAGTAGRIRRKASARAAFINRKYGNKETPGDGWGAVSPVSTGDASHAAVWLSVLLGSVLMMGGLARRGRKRKEEGHRWE